MHKESLKTFIKLHLCDGYVYSEIKGCWIRHTRRLWPTNVSNKMASK